MTLDPTQRFSNRVENYVKYRPHYPDGLVEIVREALGLVPDMTLADIGSGTGLSSVPFLKAGFRVYGIEPNPDMRAAAESYLSGYPQFTSIAGRAEATTLPDSSMDGVLAGQAFHWFDHRAARAEMLRILKPGGMVCLFWNTRQTEGNPFSEAYAQLVNTYKTDQHVPTHTSESEIAALHEFYGACGFQERTLPNHQSLDYAAFEGRVLSSSYMPLDGQPGYASMMRDLRNLFDQFQQGERLTFSYITQIYWGRPC